MKFRKIRLLLTSRSLTTMKMFKKEFIRTFYKLNFKHEDKNVYAIFLD